MRLAKAELLPLHRLDAQPYVFWFVRCVIRAIFPFCARRPRQGCAGKCAICAIPTADRNTPSVAAEGLPRRCLRPDRILHVFLLHHAAEQSQAWCQGECLAQLHSKISPRSICLAHRVRTKLYGTWRRWRLSPSMGALDYATVTPPNALVCGHDDAPVGSDGESRPRR
jgi:hypothetical protein